MSQDLINAARDGDLEKIKALVATDPDSIDFIGKLFKNENEVEVYHPYNYNFRVQDLPCEIELTALRAAVLKGHKDVVFFLLENGAVWENEVKITNNIKPYYLYEWPSPPNTDLESRKNSIAYIYMQSFPSALSMLPAQPEILKKLLLLTTDINVISSYCSRSAEQNKLFLNEAILRHEVDLIDLILNSFRVYPEGNSFKLNPVYSWVVPTTASLKNYLENKHLSSKTLSQAKLSLQYLQDKWEIKIPKEEMESLLNMHYALAEEELAAINTPPNRTLTELFAEFQYLIYPGSNLPVFPIKNMQNWPNEFLDKDVEDIKSWQSPVKLRDFLTLPESEILAHLCGTSRIDNGAAVLLQTILNYFATTEIRINNRKSPLLSNNQRALCQDILNQYYAMSDEKRDKYQCQTRADMQMTQLLVQNRDLNNKIQSLQQEMQQLRLQVSHLLQPHGANQSSIQFFKK